MNQLTMQQAIERSKKIREQYHVIELAHHGSEWTVEEDALAFLTDAALVGRLTMSHQKRWPVAGDDVTQLQHKIGESLWWLMILADRMNLNAEAALEGFLEKTGTMLEKPANI